jgi:hypothetical protein
MVLLFETSQHTLQKLAPIDNQAIDSYASVLCWSLESRTMICLEVGECLNFLSKSS